MDSQKRESLLADVKLTLKITWNNANTDKELSSMIDDTEVYMNHLLGAEIDYSAPGMFHKLFLNYCLYAHSNCSNEFESAYLTDILRCQEYVAVQQRGTQNEDKDENSSI